MHPRGVQTLSVNVGFPLDSVMVKLGPQDYWSQRMSAFTGRPHRVLFDETMEKIYSRLYQEASQLH